MDKTLKLIQILIIVFSLIVLVTSETECKYFTPIYDYLLYHIHNH